MSIHAGIGKGVRERQRNKKIKIIQRETYRDAINWAYFGVKIPVNDNTIVTFVYEMSTTTDVIQTGCTSIPVLQLYKQMTQVTRDTLHHNILIIIAARLHL